VISLQSRQRGEQCCTERTNQELTLTSNYLIREEEHSNYSRTSKRAQRKRTQERHLSLKNKKEKKKGRKTGDPAFQMLGEKRRRHRLFKERAKQRQENGPFALEARRILPSAVKQEARQKPRTTHKRNPCTANPYLTAKKTKHGSLPEGGAEHYLPHYGGNQKIGSSLSKRKPHSPRGTRNDNSQKKDRRPSLSQEEKEELPLFCGKGEKKKKKEKNLIWKSGREWWFLADSYILSEEGKDRKGPRLREGGETRKASIPSPLQTKSKWPALPFPPFHK